MVFSPLLPLICFLLFDTVPPAAVRMTGIMEQLEKAEQSRAAGKPRKVAFDITEAEVNEYLVWSLRTSPRPGLDTLKVKFFPNNYLSSLTTIDFDAVESWKPGTVPLLLKPVLNGKRAVWIDLRFRASGGKATFTVEKAYLDKVPLPAVMVSKVIELVAAQQPEKYDTTRPIPLPFGLERVWTAAKTLSGQT